MAKQKFKTKLQKMGKWTVAPTPFDTFKVFGTRTFVRVKGTIDGFEFSGMSLMPSGTGTHFLAIKSEILKAINKKSGDTVEFILEKDDTELEIPVELTEAFEASPEAKQLFDAYSYSHKRNYIRYISQSKRPETRAKRAVDTILILEKLFFEKGLPVKKKKKN